MNSEQDFLCMETLGNSIAACIRDTDVPPFVISMNAARIAYTLWTRIIKFSPSNCDWYSRDRFIIGAGVNAIIHYAMLHFTGCGLSWQDMKNYRQLMSPTPGHPEAGLTPGVEVTVGSFGAAIASGVGLAIAEEHQAARFNRPSFPIIDNYTYVIAYDGDLQEGITGEAASLAGYLRLKKLIVFYNYNSEARARQSFLNDGDSIHGKFGAMGWSVLNARGDDPDSIASAVENAKMTSLGPSIIIVTGDDENEIDSYSPPEDYCPPPEVYPLFQAGSVNGKALETDWRRMMLDYKEAYSDEYRKLTEALSGIRNDTVAVLQEFLDFPQEESTSSACIKIASRMSETASGILGSSCQLMPGPDWEPQLAFTPENPGGAIVQFGNREQASGAIINGIARYGGLMPYTTAFLVLADYMRPSVRIAAMMGVDLIYLLINDSIWNGQDGPTHQPTEQIAAWRTVPGLTVIRPADSLETARAWEYLLEGGRGPAALILNKTALPVLTAASPAAEAGLSMGAYVLYESPGGFVAIIIATGSEVHLARRACDILEKNGIGVRLVNMPSWELFEAQDDEYRQAVLPPWCRTRVSVEAGCCMGWQKYVGTYGITMGLNNFGLSAPPDELMEYFGFTPEHIANTVIKVLNRTKTL